MKYLKYIIIVFGISQLISCSNDSDSAVFYDRANIYKNNKLHKSIDGSYSISYDVGENNDVVIKRYLSKSLSFVNTDTERFIRSSQWEFDTAGDKMLTERATFLHDGKEVRIVKRKHSTIVGYNPHHFVQYMNDRDSAEIFERLMPSKEDKLKETVFTIPGNEYSVTFENNPTISNISVPFGNKFWNGKKAELVIPQFMLYCKAEMINFDEEFGSIFTEEYIKTFINEYATYNELLYPVITYSETELGKIGTVRAYKNLIGPDGQNEHTTYVVDHYIGKNSIVIIYVGAPSDYYPSHSSTKFQKSVVMLGNGQNFSNDDILNSKPFSSSVISYKSFEDLENSIASTTTTIEPATVRIYNNGHNINIGTDSYFIKDFDHENIEGIDFYFDSEDRLKIMFCFMTGYLMIQEYSEYNDTWRVAGHLFRYNDSIVELKKELSK